jgi:hypothetical protein
VACWLGDRGSPYAWSGRARAWSRDGVKRRWVGQAAGCELAQPVKHTEEQGARRPAVPVGWRRVDAHRSQGQLIAGAGGLLLFIFLFLPWFAAVGGSSLNGWQGQSSTDIYAFITALVAVITALTAGRGAVFPGMTRNGATALLGGVATLLFLWLSLGGSGHDNKIGLYLSVLAAAAIAYGGYSAAREELSGPERRPARRRPPRAPRERPDRTL